MGNNTSFNNTNTDSPITEFALALSVVNKEDYWYPSGTAIIIGTHLAITAKHVIEDYIDKYETNKQNEDLSFSLIAIQFITINNKTTISRWIINNICFSEKTDIAFLHLSPANKSALYYKWRLPKIEILPPEIGSKIYGFGYRESNIKLTYNDIIDWSHNPTTTSGEVKEIHHEKRDDCRLNYPCFRTNARFDGGMSGGPVFNDKGHLCGIICSNLPPTNESEEHASYVTLLWPSMITVINIDRQGYQSGVTYLLYDLAKDGFIKVLNLDKLIITKGEKENNCRLVYKIKKNDA